MGDVLVWALKLDTSLHQDTIGKPTSRAIDWYNKNVVVPVLNYTLLISKGKSVDTSSRFWLCPD